MLPKEITNHIVSFGPLRTIISFHHEDGDDPDCGCYVLEIQIFDGSRLIRQETIVTDNLCIFDDDKKEDTNKSDTGAKKVYLVMAGYDYEDCWCERAFDSKEKAVKFIENIGYFKPEEDEEDRWINCLSDTKKLLGYGDEKVEYSCDFMYITEMEVK